MVYTEIKIRNGRRYYYKVISIRQGDHVKKKRVYLGANLNKQTLKNKELEADKLFLNEKIRRNIEKIRPKIIRIFKKYNIKKAGLFGSYIRGEAGKNSDIDILIKPTKNMGFEFAGLEIRLTKTLKKKVDLVSYNGISPHLKDKILREEVRII